MLITDLQDQEFIKALQAEGAELYLVGGCVRDHLLGQQSKDLDLLVRLLDDQKINSVLKRFGTTSLVGRSFGVIKFWPKNKDIEIDVALPRVEKSTGEGHRDFAVDFNPQLTLNDDLIRRDFTINAIAMDLNSGQLVDPFHGQQDLQNKSLRMVFETAFQEDPLRLMRGIQFAARFELTIEPQTLLQMKQNAHLIKTVAPERIASEIAKLMSAPKPSFGFDLMIETGLLPFVFPDISKTIGVTQPQKNGEDVYTHTMKVLDASRAATELEKPGDLDIMFSALFHDTGKPKTKRESETQQVSFFNHQHVSTGIARRWMKDFKISTIGVDTQKVCHLVKNHMFETTHFKDNDRALRRFINKVGVEYIYDLVDLRLADKKGGRFPKKVYGILQLREKIKEEISKQSAFSIKDLAVTGHDIIQLGIKPGPLIGAAQRYLLDKVLDEPSLNQKETLLKLLIENKSEWEPLVHQKPHQDE